MRISGEIKITTKRLTACTVALLWSLSPAHANPHAGTTEDDVDSVCKGTLSSAPLAGDKSGDPSGTQRLQHCQAAKSAQEGADADNALYKVWAGVAAVCTGACVSSFAGGPAGESACTGSAVAGAGTDGVVTKNYASSLQQIGGIGLAAATTELTKDTVKEGAEEGAKQGVEQGTKKTKDIGSCMNAATATTQSVSKFKSLEGQKETVKSSLESARSVTSTQGTAVADGSGISQSQAATAGGGPSADGSLGGPSGGPSDGGSSNPCAGQLSGRSTPASTLQCAIARDPNIPRFVTTPKFAKEFQDRTKTSLGDFLNKNDPPALAIGQAVRSGLNGAQNAKLASALTDVQQNVSADYSTYSSHGGDGSQYEGGGGNSGLSNGDDDLNLGGLLSGLQDKLNPNQKPNEKSTGVSAVIFANQTRSPAAVAEDAKLSIFDRVTYRYYYVGRRIVLGEDMK